MTENHFRSHFSPFQINTQLFLSLQNGCRRPFWMTENHFRSHFSPFQINTQLFLKNGGQRPFWMPDLPKSIGTSRYSRSVDTSNTKLIGAFVITSPPIGGGRGIVMPMSVCVCVCLFVCVFVCLFVRVFAKFQSVISQPFLNRSL